MRANAHARLDREASLRDDGARSHPHEPRVGRKPAQGHAVLPQHMSTIVLLRLKTRSDDTHEVASRLAAVAALDGFRNEMTLHRRVHEWFRREPHRSKR